LITVACPAAKRYFRRFLNPIKSNNSPYDQAVPPSEDQAFDVITEIWFESKEIFDAIPGMNDSEISGAIMKDEKKLFDLAGGVFRFTYHEKETQLPD
jgi:hypothetical protein